MSTITPTGEWKTDDHHDTIDTEDTEDYLEFRLTFCSFAHLRDVLCVYTSADIPVDTSVDTSVFPVDTPSTFQPGIVTYESDMCASILYSKVFI